MNTCRSCGAEIVWVETVNGKKMPVDAKPSPNGNIIVADGKGTVLGSMEADHYRHDPEEELYLSHFSTCPGAGLHRKKK